MMRNVATIALVLLCLMPVQAQSSDPVILSYQRNFIRASMSTKATAGSRPRERGVRDRGVAPSIGET